MGDRVQQMSYIPPAPNHTNRICDQCQHYYGHKKGNPTICPTCLKENEKREQMKTDLCKSCLEEYETDEQTEELGICGDCTNDYFTTCDLCDELTVPIIDGFCLETCAACTPEEYITHLCENETCSGHITVQHSNIWKRCPECKTVQFLEDHENHTPAMMYDGTCSKCGDYARDCICGQ